MQKKIRVMTTKYKNITISGSDAYRIRGFFADLDRKDVNLHNHLFTGEEVYRYPRVQYKVLGGKPFITAVEEGIRSLHPLLMEQRELRIGDRVFTDLAMDIRLDEMVLGDCRSVYTYKFLSPWISLNQENYAKYKAADSEDRKQLLSGILIGNILSLCKGLGVTVENRLTVELDLKPIAVFYKGRKMDAFSGTFQVNCRIPDYLGIGKGSARGFGTVKCVREEDGKVDA